MSMAAVFWGRLPMLKTPWLKTSTYIDLQIDQSGHDSRRRCLDELEIVHLQDIWDPQERTHTYRDWRTSIS